MKQNTRQRSDYTSLRAVIYCRVSSEKQEEEGTSLDIQEECCEAYANERGYIIVKKVRETWTGSQLTERKKLAEIREMGRNGEFDVLIINTFDRLSRNNTHLTVLFYEAKTLGIRIECVQESLDDSPIGEHIRNTYGLLAELERTKIIDRTQGGRRKRVQNGRLLPGGKPKYGYQWRDEDKGAYAINEPEAAIVQEVFTYYTSVKTSINGLTQMLIKKGYPPPSGKGVWSRAAVYHILADPIYTGKAYGLRYKGKDLRPQEEWMLLPDGLVPAIISDSTFNRAKELLAINKQESVRNNGQEPTELLRCGFVFCGYCKRPMVVNRFKRVLKNGGQTLYAAYACRHLYSEGVQIGCKYVPDIMVHELDPAVWGYVGNLLQDFALVEKAISLAKGKRSFSGDLKAVEYSIESLQAQQEELVQDLKRRGPDGKLLAHGRGRELILIELDQTEKDIRELVETREKLLAGQLDWQRMQNEVDEFIAWGRKFKDTYETASYEEKRRAIRHFGIAVYVYQKGDTHHPRYDIQVKIPEIRDIVLPATVSLANTTPAGFSYRWS